MLRDTWGFDGFVVSDANAVRSLVTHGFAADLADAAARGVNAGVDIEMAMFDPAYGHLPAAFESGAADPGGASTHSVRRVLTAKFAMGLFDAPYVDEERAQEVLADPAHREVARVAAERSAVLLRNEDDLLPLDAGGLTSIAVIGALADSKRDTLGPWVFDFDLDETVTVLEGIRAHVGDRCAGRLRAWRRHVEASVPVTVRPDGPPPVDRPEGLRRRRGVRTRRRRSRQRPTSPSSSWASGRT